MADIILYAIVGGVVGFLAVIEGPKVWAWWEGRAPKNSKQEEVPIEKVPKKILYQIVQQKDTRTIILRAKKFSTKKKDFIVWKARMFFPNHIIKETIGSKDRYLARFNVNYAEAMNTEGEIEYSEELNNLLLNDMMGQLRRAVGVIGGLVFDRTTIILLAMGFLFGNPIGFSYNDIFHWVPNTVVHWIPRS